MIVDIRDECGGFQQKKSEQAYPTVENLCYCCCHTVKLQTQVQGWKGHRDNRYGDGDDKAFSLLYVKDHLYIYTVRLLLGIQKD